MRNEWKRQGKALAAITIAVTAAGANRAHATSYNWAKTASGSFTWNDTTTPTNNWSKPGTFPNAAGDVANVTSNINGTETINVTAAITLGTLNIGDTNNSDHFALTGSAITFDDGDPGTTAAAINFSAGSHIDSIANALIIAPGENLTVTLLGASGPTIGGGLSGSGNLSIAAGTGTLNLGGTGSSFTGNVFVTTGTLKMATSTSFFSNGSSTIAIASGAKWDLLNTTDSVAGLSDISGAGGTITTTATGGGAARNITLAGAGTYSYTGKIADGATASLGISKSGTGFQVLGGINTYSGATTITHGTLQFSTTASLYNDTTASWTAANITVGSSATLAVNVGGTGEFSAGDLSTLIAGVSTISTNGLKSGSSLGLDTTNATGGAFTYSGVIKNSTGAGSGAVGLTKLGTGSLVLTGGNLYTGATSVTAGSLIVGDGTGGSLANSAVSVSNGATLGGLGSVSGTVTTAGTTSKISPGTASVGTLTLNGLDATAGADLVFGLGASSGGGVSGQIDLGAGAFTGSTAAGGLVFELSAAGAGPVANTPYTLVKFGSSSGVDYSDISAVLAPGMVLDTGFGTGGDGFNITGSDIELQFSSVPEPGSLSILMAGASGLLIRRRGRAAASKAQVVE